MRHSFVLSVSFYPILLKTRSQLLQTAGYTVVSAYSTKEALMEFAHGDFDFVLLCHTIPVQDRERLAYLIRQHSAMTPIITIAETYGQCDSFTDATIDNNPHHLVTSLQEALRSCEGFRRSNGGDGHAA